MLWWWGGREVELFISSSENTLLVFGLWQTGDEEEISENKSRKNKKAYWLILNEQDFEYRRFKGQASSFWRRAGSRGGSGEGVKVRQENMHCDGKVLGDKEGNRLSLVLLWADRRAFVFHPLVRRPPNFHSFLISLPLSLPPSLPYFKRTGSPTSSSPFASALKRSERRKWGARSASQLLINMQISDSLRALIT